MNFMTDKTTRTPRDLFIATLLFMVGLLTAIII